jgi:hypothetical protein
MNIKSMKFGFVLIVAAFAVSSWLLIHVLAFLGVFLALAYPLWWIFAPNRSTCFLCKAGGEGWKCPLCKGLLHKHMDKPSPAFLPAIFNGVLIFIFSLVSAGVVYAENRVLFKSDFPLTPKTVSLPIPAKGQYLLGEVFPLKIEIAGIKTPINAVQVDLGFETEKLEVQEVSTDGSFASIFVQKEFNNNAGFVRLSGGLPNPGYSSEQGLFGTVYFKTKAPGAVTIEYLPSSMVLANDGHGTNVVKDLASVSYLILPESAPEEVKIKGSFTTEASISAENTQMKFYEEESVLGKAVEREIQKDKEFSLSETFLAGLQKTDEFVLQQWWKIFAVFTPTDGRKD